MQKVYTVEVESHDRHGIPQNRENFDVVARTAEQAIRKSKQLARLNGFVKSHALSVNSLKLIISDLK